MKFLNVSEEKQLAIRKFTADRQLRDEELDKIKKAFSPTEEISNEGLKRVFFSLVDEHLSGRPSHLRRLYSALALHGIGLPKQSSKEIGEELDNSEGTILSNAQQFRAMLKDDCKNYARRKTLAERARRK